MIATSERVLPTTWALTAGDVAKLCGQPLDEPPHTVLIDDVEGLCRGAMADAQRRRVLSLDMQPGDWMEVLGFLLGEVVKRGQRFDPSRRGIEFRPWLYNELRAWGVKDAKRWLYGRDGRHRLPADLRTRAAGDAEQLASGVDLDDFDPVGDPVDPASLVDPADRVDARGWLDSAGDRDEDRSVGVAGVEARVGAAGGDHGAGARAGGGSAGGARGSAHWVDCLSCGWRTFAQAPNGKPGWHVPESCSSCGAALEPVEAAA